jgi:hypothetical protein
MGMFSVLSLRVSHNGPSFVVQKAVMSTSEQVGHQGTLTLQMPSIEYYDVYKDGTSLPPVDIFPSRPVGTGGSIPGDNAAEA